MKVTVLKALELQPDNRQLQASGKTRDMLSKGTVSSRDNRQQESKTSCLLPAAIKEMKEKRISSCLEESLEEN